MNIVQEFGSKVVGVGVVVDRSGGKAILHEQQFAVTEQTAMSYDPKDIPEDLAKIPIEKPGSRSLK